MNRIYNKIKEANFNIIYNIYNSYSSNIKLEIIFTIIEVFQNFGIIINALV